MFTGGGEYVSRFKQFLACANFRYRFPPSLTRVSSGCLDTMVGDYIEQRIALHHGYRNAGCCGYGRHCLVASSPSSDVSETITNVVDVISRTDSFT